MRGLKENVVVGRLIPAGTGMDFHDKLKTKSTDPDEYTLSSDDLEAALRQEIQDTNTDAEEQSDPESEKSVDDNQ